VAKEAGLSTERLTVALVLAQAGVICAIIGASKAEQLPQVLAASDTALDPQVIAKLDTITGEFRSGEDLR